MVLINNVIGCWVLFCNAQKMWKSIDLYVGPDFLLIEIMFRVRLFPGLWQDTTKMNQIFFSL